MRKYRMWGGTMKVTWLGQAGFLLEKNGNVLVLAGANAWQKVRTLGGSNNYVRFRPGCRWTWENFTFAAVKAEHSDPESIGVIVDDGSWKLYFSGNSKKNNNNYSIESKYSGDNKYNKKFHFRSDTQAHWHHRVGKSIEKCLLQINAEGIFYWITG